MHHAPELAAVALHNRLSSSRADSSAVTARSDVASIAPGVGRSKTTITPIEAVRLPVSFSYQGVRAPGPKPIRLPSARISTTPAYPPVGRVLMPSKTSFSPRDPMPQPASVATMASMAPIVKDGPMPITIPKAVRTPRTISEPVSSIHVAPSIPKIDHSVRMNAPKKTVSMPAVPQVVRAPVLPPDYGPRIVR